MTVVKLPYSTQPTVLGSIILFVRESDSINIGFWYDLHPRSFLFLALKQLGSVPNIWFETILMMLLPTTKGK